jgi:hypothetical protein
MSGDLRRRRSEDRVDQLVDALGNTRAVLDDLARTRVAARVLEQCRAAEPAPQRLHPWRWAIGAAVASALVTGLILRATRQPAVAPIEPVVIAGELPDGAMLSAPSGAAVRAQIAGAQITMRGPGWAARRGPRLVAEATALTVERSQGDDPVEIEVNHATVRVLHATVYLASQQVLRVAVTRGEIVLRCPGDDADRPVIAGQSATCDPRDAARRPAPVPPPSPSVQDAPLLPSTAAAAPDTPRAAVADEPPPTPRAPAPDRAAPVPVAEASPAPGTIAKATPEPGAIAKATPEPETIAKATPEPPAPHLAPWPATAIEPAPPPVDTAARPAPPAVPAPHLAPRPTTTVDPAPPSVDTAGRYAAIERLMVRDPAAARTALRALVADAPTSPEAASALLDLARLAAAAADAATARAALDQLERHPDAAALAMPARYLRCTLEQTDPGRRACLYGFRTAFPDSPRDAEVLARLAIMTAHDGDCRAALPLLAEYQRRYSERPAAAAVRAWTAHCQAAAAP